MRRQFILVCGFLALLTAGPAGSPQIAEHQVDATKQTAESAKAPEAKADTILGDEKASLEWISLRLQSQLKREQAKAKREEAGRLEAEASVIDRDTDAKAEAIRQAAKVPADYVGELRGNQVVFVKPEMPPTGRSPQIAAPRPAPSGPAKKGGGNP